MMNSDISNEDTKSYPNLKPVWIDDNDSYSPTIELEKKLESIKKKYNELNYEHLELKNYCESMETELKAMKEEKLKLETLCEKNTAQIPNYRLKIVELNKMNKELKSEKKELEMNIDNYKSKRNGVDQQLKDAIHENFTLRMNNKKLLQEKKACEDGKLKNIKDKDILKSENEKTKAIINDLKIEILAYKSQISLHNEQLQAKDIICSRLILDNKIKDTNIKQYLEENKKHQKYVAVTNKKYFDTQRKCRKSINEYAGLQKENLRLKGEIVTNTAFIEEIQSLKSRHRNTIRQLRKVESLVRRQELQILSQQNKIAEVERLKVRYIYTGKDITEYKKEIQQWKDKYTDLRLQFDNLDCPFFQSKYGKNDVPNESICDVLNEKHYISRIHVLELKIKTLYEQIEALKNKDRLQYQRAMNQCSYDRKKAEATIKELKKVTNPFKIQLANRDATISTLDKQLRIQSTIINNNDKNELGIQSTVFGNKVKYLQNIMEANKRESIESRQEINKLKSTVTRFTHENQNLKKSVENFEMINKTIVKSNYKQPRAYSIEESLQKKNYRLQDQLNVEKSKYSDLLTQFKNLKDQNEINHKANVKNLNDALSEIRRLKCLPKELMIKDNILEKLKEENNLIKSKTKDHENRLKYMQNNLSKLNNKTAHRVLSTRVLEMVCPEMNKNKKVNDVLVNSIIKCRTKLNESNLTKNQKYKGKSI